ncbi:MAG: LacI family DNA-binding transcriptional regulator [Micrococcales bacterium]
MSELDSGKRNGAAPATIYDIAKLAGVNPSTVSRALTTPGRISAKTEAKIRAAATELNYRVNPFARALPTGRTKLIAFTIADITNPVFFNLVRGAEQVAAEAGYTLVLAESQESSTREASTLERILPMVDGVVMGTTRLEDSEISKVNADKPVVLANRHVEGVADVVPNIEPGIHEAVRHLAELGHKHIAFLSGPAASWMNTARWQEIMKAAVSQGMTVVEIGPNPPTLETGRESLDRIRAAGVTAVITYNDLMAIGLLRRAVEAGVSVPEELSIIGFDNSFGSDFTTPALTTIGQPLTEIGARAVYQMLEILGEKEQQESQPVLSTSLIVRGSTTKPRL